MKKYLLILTALALLGASCSTEDTPGTTAGEGTAEFRTIICSQVENDTQVRAMIDLPANCQPAADNFHLVVRNQEGTVEYLAEYQTFSTYTAPPMPRGHYSATISYGNPSQEGSAAYCYEGSSDFTILARETIQGNITASLTNAAVSLECSEWFNKYYVDAQFIVRTASDNSFSFVPATSAQTIVFVKPGTKLFLKGTATKAQNGVQVVFPEQEIGGTTARTWHKIAVDASQAGQGSLSIRLDDTLTPVLPEEIELNPDA